MIDKKNMYYIVATGTNDRNTVAGGKAPLIATAEAADKEIKSFEDISHTEGNYEKISIHDYEEKFGVDKPAGEEIIHESIVPTLIVRGGSIDDITIKQIGTSTHVYRKSADGSKHHVAVITGTHEDLWPQRNYPVHLINYTNQVKGGRIYFTVKVIDKDEQEALL